MSKKNQSKLKKVSGGTMLDSAWSYGQNAYDISKGAANAGHDKLRNEVIERGLDKKTASMSDSVMQSTPVKKAAHSFDALGKTIKKVF